MATQLRIPFALKEGRLIHIEEVSSGTKHGAVCPECSLPLVARKGVKTRHHFGHLPNIQCNPETVLHRIAKMLLCDAIKEALDARRPIPVTWNCCRCGDVHQGDLIRKAQQVRLEHSSEGCRPDITLFDAAEQPIAALEIVVTHAPEEYVKAYCKSAKIGLLQFHLKTEGDLDTLRRAKALKAELGSVCLRRKCPRCKAPTRTIMLYVVDGRCWKCRAVMKIAFTSCEGIVEGPSEFSGAARRLARENGALLRERYSNVVKKRYLANTCGRCGSFCGDFYLHDFWHLASHDTGVCAGYECYECSWAGNL